MADKQVPGGYGPTEDANQEIQEHCDQVKHQVEKDTGESYLEFKAIKYRRQTVKGTNFLIKVHVGGPDYVHLIVFRELGGKVSLTKVQDHQTKDSPLQHF
ncbi:cystatin-A [Etheostoma spectabile]|uniref:cystatin-A n=1 Tax=Etheostoma spectabile TaxID=54343 RepID=UPI0013AEFD57|nr:cystatin-A-like [Etheostoma spectabile]